MDLLQEAFIHPPEPCEARRLLWMDALYLIILGCWTETCHYKAWKSQDNFNLTQIGFVWKKKVIYTYDALSVSKTWANFHF